MTGRIRDRAVFARFRSEGRRFRDGPIWCAWIPDPLAVPPRFAFAVGRSVGGAVIRNRLRRRLREAATAEVRAGLPAGWYLLGARPPATQLAWADLAAAVHRIADAVRREAAP